MSDTVTLLVFSIPYIAVWAASVIEVFRRNDLGTTRTVMWIAALVLLPLIGLLAYIVLRPARAVESSRLGASTEQAEAIVVLAERRQRGELDEADYLSELAAIRPDPSTPR